VEKVDWEIRRFFLIVTLNDAVNTQILSGLPDNALAAMYGLVYFVTGLVGGAHNHSAGVVCQVLQGQDWREHKVYQRSSANKSVWYPYGTFVRASRGYVTVAELEQPCSKQPIAVRSHVARERESFLVAPQLIGLDAGVDTPCSVPHDGQKLSKVTSE